MDVAFLTLKRDLMDLKMLIFLLAFEQIDTLIIQEIFLIK